MRQVPVIRRPKILLVGDPDSVGIDKMVEYCIQYIEKQCRAEACVSVALRGAKTPNAIENEEQMLLDRRFAEVWFLGNKLSMMVVKIFSLTKEANCKIRSGAPRGSNLYNFLHVLYGVPHEVR